MLHSLLFLSVLIFHSLSKLCADSRIQTIENYTEQFKIEKAESIHFFTN